MQIPQFWAEARLEDRVGKRKRVMRRFGWSDDSLEAAQQHANERANEAMRRLQAGEQVDTRDRKLRYGDDQGLPIREEVVARSGDDVVTRNSYGARCLNQPDVLFADIDLDFMPGGTRLLWIFLIEGPLLVSVTWLLFDDAWLRAAASILILAFGIWQLNFLYNRNRTHRRDQAAARQRETVRSVVRSYPKMRVALYETPNGLRLLALHDTYKPSSATTLELLQEFDSDETYAHLCRIQNCFRARVSPKPWRIGAPRITPGGVWPVADDRRAERDAWIDGYEAASTDYAACRFLEEFGDGDEHPRCRAVQRMHDEMCRARTDLPIA